MNRMQFILDQELKMLDGMYGIYIIYCSANGKYYVGSTIQGLKRRWNKHKNQLRRKIHHSSYLQNAWNLYRPEHFRCFLLEVVYDKSKLLEREQYYLDLLKASDRDFGFNISPKASSCLRRSLSEEHKAKISKANKKRYADPIIKKQLSDRMKGTSLSEKTKEKLRKANLGKKHGESTKNKISMKHKGHEPYNPKLSKEDVLEIKKLNPTGTKLKKELALEYKVSLSTIYAITSGRRWNNVTHTRSS